MDHSETHLLKGIKTQKHYDVSWVDVESPNHEIFERLENEYHLHPVHLNESIQKVQHNQVEREENYLFFVLHVPLFNEQMNKIIVNQVGVFLGRDFLITIRKGRSPFITDLFSECQHEQKPREEYFKKGSSYLLYGIIARLLGDISDMTDSIEMELDAIEDLVFEDANSDAQRIGKVRHEIIKLRRVIGPKRYVLQDLADQIDTFSGRSVAKHYSNNTKTINKLWEVIEEAKETVEVYKDADFTTSTEQTNRILAVLTIIFTFTIPITVVGTLYGMNVPLPGGNQTGAWTFIGRYTTFEVLLSLSVAMAVGMYLYFRNKKWF